MNATHAYAAYEPDDLTAIAGDNLAPDAGLPSGRLVGAERYYDARDSAEIPSTIDCHRERDHRRDVEPLLP